MALETKGKPAVHIAWLGETDTLALCQSPWNIPLLPVKKLGASDSHESDSSIQTGVHCPGLKDPFFSLPLAEVSQPSFVFK